MNDSSEERRTHVADLLLKNRGSGTDWGIFQLNGVPWSKQLANRFVLCSLLDWQMPSDRAWGNGDRLIDMILGNPPDIWQAITSVSEIEWNSKRDEYGVHRFPAGHNRLWKIGRSICRMYEGDARNVWKDKGASEARETLWNLGAGDQISRMIVGGLRDCGQLTGFCDVKGDVYVRRVLGRAFYGQEMEAEKAVILARQLHAADPWQLDSQLWQIGKLYCKKTPACTQCYLAPHCAYALERRRP